MTAPIEITVVREAKSWKIRYGSVALDYATQAEALADAIAIARAYGKAGDFSTVRTGVMTSVYGPDGFIRAVATLKQAAPAPQAEPSQASRPSLPDKTFRPAMPPRRRDERGRISQIASAFEVSRKNPA